MVGLLLTPVVAWAASFLGGWLGSLAATLVSGDRAALVLMAASALLGALLGTLIWIKLLLRYRLPLIQDETAENE